MKTFKQYYYDVAYLTEQNYNVLMPGWDDIKSSNKVLDAAVTVMTVIDNVKGAECLIVGGAVRDMFMGRRFKDIDLATNMDLSAAAKLLNDQLGASVHSIGNSKDFGVLTVVYKGFDFELAEYRSETGNRMTAKVKMVKDFNEDSKRRDITINSMGMNKEGEVFDPNGGREDIKNKVIRAVGNPADRMKEDPLRMLRAIRFAAKYGYDLDERLLKVIIKQKDLIFGIEDGPIRKFFNWLLKKIGITPEERAEPVSAERLGMELWKAAAASGPEVANYIQQLKRSGLLKKFLPEIDVMDQFEQSKEHHPEGNVYNHTIEVLKASKVRGNPVAMLATLFHDVGKPVTYKYIEPTPDFPEGKHTYYGHDAEGEKLWHKIAEKLRYPGTVKKGIGQVIGKHMFPYALLKPEGEGYPSDDKIVKNTFGLEPNVIITYGDETYDINLQEILKSVNDADIDGRPSDGEVTSKRQSSDKDEIWGAVKNVTKKFGDAKAIKAKIQGIINGKKIMQWFPEIKQGPIYKQIIDAVTEWVFNQHPTGDPTDEETKEFVTDFLVDHRS